MNTSEEIKKKRGRKPKNTSESSTPSDSIIIEKKKRGRKKKYEVENFYKLKNKDLMNNFDHNIVYSDDDETNQNGSNEKQIKKVSFGNLDIIVSKTIKEDDNYRNNIINEINKASKINSLINENEYSDEEEIIPVESIINLNQENFEKYYKENVKYNTKESENFNKEKSIKRLRVVTTLKNVIKDSRFPEKTNVCCWWCCHQFDTSPCTLPIDYDPSRKKYTFIGIFCSWNCTKSYNLNSISNKKFERSELITLLIKQIYGITHAVGIKSAPPRESLKMFGGYMDISEFRNDFSIVSEYNINLIKFNYIYPEVTEITNLNIKNNKKNLRLSRN